MVGVKFKTGAVVSFLNGWYLGWLQLPQFTKYVQWRREVFGGESGCN